MNAGTSSPPSILISGRAPAKSKDPRPRWAYSGAFDNLRLSGGGMGFGLFRKKPAVLQATPLRAFGRCEIAKGMQIELYLDGLLIGCGDVDAVDTVMGMAIGSFEPEAAYDRDTHSTEIDGVENPSGWKVPFVVQTADGEPIVSEAVSVVDSAATAGARLVALLGIAYPAYEKFFGENLIYKERWQAAVGGPQVDTLYMFVGIGGAMAYTLDASGANLPQQYAPWKFRREVSTDGPTFKAGADRAALDEVRKTGFAVAVFSINIEEGDKL